MRKVALMRVELHDVAQQGAHDARGFGAGSAGPLDRHFVTAEVR
jgi:hypothetical protein